MKNLLPKQKHIVLTQSGFVLLTALLFLLITTTLGVTILKMNTMDERMVVNFARGYQCMQAAEAGLKFGENRVRYMGKDDYMYGHAAGDGPSKIYSRESDIIGDIKARDIDWWRANALEFNASIKGVDDPFVIIQFLFKIGNSSQSLTSDDSGVGYYRVTSRCKDRSDTMGTEVILQSIFTRPL